MAKTGGLTVSVPPPAPMRFWAVSGVMLGPSGVLGFHAIYPAEGQDLPDAATIAAATETALRGLESYLIEMGINPVLSEIAALVERDSLFLPARAERNALGIETSVPQVAGLAEPGAAQL